MLRHDDAGTSAPVLGGALVRVDRAQLRPHRPQPDGAVRFDAVLARVGQTLQYSWGPEIATLEALSDPVYRETLRGLALTRRHPRSGRVDVAERVQGDGEVVGAILDARFDEAEGAMIIEIVVQDPGAIADVRSGLLGEVSEGYDVTDLVVVDGVGQQRRRAPNHVALVERGRMPGAVVRTDGEPMDPDDLIKRVDAMCAQMDEMKTRVEGMSRIDELSARMDAFEDFIKEKKTEEKTETEERQDAASEQLRQDAIEAEVDARTTLRADAAALQVTLPVEAKTSAELRRAIALGLGADAARLDAADGQTYAEAWIAAQPRGSAAAHRRTATTRTPSDTYTGA